jgi:hypothetical protein
VLSWLDGREHGKLESWLLLSVGVVTGARFRVEEKKAQWKAAFGEVVGRKRWGGKRDKPSDGASWNGHSEKMCMAVTGRAVSGRALHGAWRNLVPGYLDAVCATALLRAGCCQV